MEFESKYAALNPSKNYIECDLNLDLNLGTLKIKKKFIKNMLLLGRCLQLEVDQYYHTDDDRVGVREKYVVQ